MTDQTNKKADKPHNKHKAALRKGEKQSLEILFFRLGETDFCARKDDFIDITGGNIIYHLPLTPAYLDGVVDLNGATTYVFNLATLVGITSSISADEGTLLVISRKDPPAAFRIDEISGEAIIKNDEIIPIPAYLKSEFINTCAIHEERLIPIINLNRIFKSIRSERIETPAKLSLSPPAGVANKNLSKEKIKFFLLGKETFATLEFDPGQPLFKPNNIAIIPGTPDFVLGISLFQGLALTIIDTSIRLNDKKSEGRKVLISKTGKDLFGFIVDAEKKRHKNTKDKTLKLPHLTCKKWMTSAIFTGTEVIPILKLSSLLSPEERTSKEMLAKKYKPDHLFEQSFFKQKVNISEFILMGKHHALPAIEVKEIIRLKRYRNLPGLPSIVMGVSEHKGALLPVIDIEACFGIKSEMTKSWKMIHLENGDFSALVVTKAALDEKELPPELHRKMPLMMKHRFLYGCYPNNEAKMISLTLNVYKMAVYFDKEMLQEIFKHSISGIKEDKTIKTSEASSTKSGALLDAPDNLNGQATNLAPGEDTIGLSPATKEQKDGAEVPNKQQGVPINREDAKTDPLHKPEQPGEILATTDEQNRDFEGIKDNQENIKGEPSLTAKETFHIDPDLPIRPAESAQHSFPPKVSAATRSSSVTSKILNRKDGLNTERLKNSKSKGSLWIALSIFLLLCIALFLFFSPGRQPIKEEANIQPHITTIKEPIIDEKPSPAEKKEAAIQSEDDLVQAEAVEANNNPIPEKQQPATPLIAVGTIKPVNKNITQTLKPKKWKRNKNKYYPPLGEFDFYTVEEGDTLWDIAEAYSKNPYDYNLVAEDNKIIDPDLIYPGQRLRLQKKLKVDKTALPEQNEVIP